MKICRRCNLEKPFGEFVKHKRYSDGFYCYCKICVREKNKEYKPTDEAKERRLEKKALYRERNREKIRETDRESYKNDPEKFKEKSRVQVKKYLEKSGYEHREERKNLHPEVEQARQLVKSAIRNGSMIRPEQCEKCNRHHEAIEAHHEDYFKPLEVQWLCRPCHRKIHRKDDHRKRLSGKTAKADATVQPTEETCGEKSEAVSPPLRNLKRL